MKRTHVFSAVLLCLLGGSAWGANKLVVPVGQSFETKDSLNPAEESSADARACLAGLTWPAGKFVVRCDKPKDRGDALVRFPSPVPSGDEVNDLVAVEWYAAKNEEQEPIVAPAVVVVHESGKNMNVGRIFARGLQVQGIHAFMIQLPFYGERRAGGGKPSAENLVQIIRQAVADVRRARDAVAALPLVDTKNICLQGTSLGGFVSATTASLDRGYDRVFLMLAGGDLYDVLQNGGREASQFRSELDKAGFSGDKLKTLLASIEPTRIAHRMDPERTWLYTAKMDQVVPLKNANLLARAARLDGSHHVMMFADHYTGVIYLPYVLPHIRGNIGR